PRSPKRRWTRCARAAGWPCAPPGRTPSARSCAGCRPGREGRKTMPDEVENPGGSGRMNILLVDDQPDGLLALEAILGPLDQNLRTASSGREALRLLLKEDYALILLDVVMPGMDGFETAQLIRERERTRYTPIIFLTAARKGEGPLNRGYETGAVDFIFKPIDPEGLRSKV